MKVRFNLTKSTVALAACLFVRSLVAEDMSGVAGANTSNSIAGCLTNLYNSNAGGVAFLQNMTIPHGGGLMKWNPGPKIDLSVGYKIAENVAVELQYGFAVNGLSKLDGMSSLAGSTHLWTVPVMANGIYGYAFNDHWQAYGGVGVGALISVMDTSSQTYTDCEFGYQAILGVKYLFNDSWACGLGYGFLGSLDHHFNSTTSPTYMHSVVLSLTHRF